jgi:hypothetical protein
LKGQNHDQATQQNRTNGNHRLGPGAYAQTGKEKLSPEGEQFKRTFAKAIKYGHVNKVCQDMKGTWETVEGAEEFRVCRPEKGFIEVSPATCDF